MLEKSHLKHIYSIPLYSFAEKSAVVNEKLTQESPQDSTPANDIVRKHVLVVHPGSKLASEESELLIKILQAVNVALGDTALINDSSFTSYKNLIQQYDYSKMICFGITGKELGLELVKNAVSIQDKCKYLYTDSLADLAKDASKKKVLWGALKELFAV